MSFHQLAQAERELSDSTFDDQSIDDGAYPASDSDVTREMFPGDEWDLHTFRNFPVCSGCGADTRKGEHCKFGCSQIPPDLLNCWRCKEPLAQEEFDAENRRGYRQCFKCKAEKEREGDLWRLKNADSHRQNKINAGMDVTQHDLEIAALRQKYGPCRAE